MNQPAEKPLAVRETQELATQAADRGITFSNIDQMREFARDVVNSGLAPRDFKTPEAVLVAMQHGMEIGLTPLASLQSIAVINGRPTLYGDGLMAVALAHPDCVDIIETFERGTDEDTMRAICEIQRRDKVALVRTFSVGDAKKAGLWKKAGPWTLYPKRMLQMRARAFAIRDAFADALKGIRCAEEERDIEPRRVEARVVSREMILDASPEETPTESAGAVSVSSNAGSASVELIPEGRAKVKCDAVSPGHVGELDPQNEAGEFVWEGDK